MSNIADKFEELGVIPVVVLNDTKDALPLAKALVEGGLPCAEVTFRTEAAEESIRLMHEAYPDRSSRGIYPPYARSISRYGTCSRYSTYNRAG